MTSILTLQEIRKRAKTLGVKNISRFRKDDLIRAVQEQEGNSPCFKAIPQCGEDRCLWRDGCQSG